MRTTRAVSVTAMPVAGLALLLAACGTEQPSSPGPASPDAVTIAMENYRFEPATADVRVGQTVRWENRSTGQHNAVAKKGADFKSGLFGAGGSFEWRAERAGTVTYICTIHNPPMEGTLRVR